MSLKIFLIAIAVTTVSALALWLWIVFSVDPLVASPLDFGLFYLTTLLWVTGGLAMIGFYFRLLKSHNEFYYGNLITSLRQGAFAGVFISLTLYLRSMRAIELPETSLLLLAFVLFELYFSAKK